MKEWLIQELERMPRQALLLLAQKEDIHIEKDLDKKLISQKLMKELKRRIVEDYAFFERQRDKMSQS